MQQGGIGTTFLHFKQSLGPVKIICPAMPHRIIPYNLFVASLEPSSRGLPRQFV